MKKSPLDYAYSIGKVRAMERHLIRGEVFEEAVESGLDEALRLFAESEVYSSDILHVRDSAALEGLLEREIAGLKKLVRGLLLDDELRLLIDMKEPARSLTACAKFKSGFLKDYLNYLIDMKNIEVFLRFYIFKEPKEDLSAHLTCEGFIKKKDLLELYDKEIAAFLNRLEYVHKDGVTIDYTYHLGDAIQATVNENSFVKLEKAIDDLLVGILKPAKYLNFGPEPVLAYYFARRNEIDLIRMIILAKLNGVENALVKERVNTVYA